MKKSLSQVLAIVIVSGLIAIGVNAFRADGIPLVEHWHDKVLNEQLAEGLPAVSLAQAKEAFASEAAVFVDARGPDFFELGHIPGAVNLPVRNFDQVFPRVKQLLLTAPRLIIYCDGANCEMSVELIDKLLMAGIAHVEIFPGGIEQWQAEGQPMEAGLTGSTH